MKFIDQFSLKDKKILFRFDYNVPLDGSQHITDDTRIRATLPTLNYALDEGAQIIIASHLGRPKGKVKPEFSLAPWLGASPGSSRRRCAWHRTVSGRKRRRWWRP